jgi:hypothetical protein
MSQKRKDFALDPSRACFIAEPCQCSCVIDTAHRLTGIMSKSGKGEEIFECEITESGTVSDAKLNNFRSGILENKAQDGSIDDNSVKPSDAFEVFNGKLFGVARTEHSVADAIERRFVGLRAPPLYLC